MDDLGRLVIGIAERSRSKVGRPRMADDVEQRLEELERSSARTYADMEYTAFRLDKLSELMADEEAVPEPWSDNDYQDSLVHHIEDTLVQLAEEKKKQKK
jgi:hypothetical protein